MLRRLASGEGVNAAIDWPNIIEELHDLGLSELRVCVSFLQQAMTHLLKLHAWPASTSANRWRDEVGAFLDGATDRFTPSMRQRLDLDALYVKALRRARTSVDASGAPAALPQTCRFTRDALLAGDVQALSACVA